MEEQQNYALLPTGKPHISYSEMRSWTECSYRHKLQHVDKINLSKPGIHMDFGTAIHYAIEYFLPNRVMNISLFENKFHDLWTINSKLNSEQYTDDYLKSFINEGKLILNDFPQWFEQEFQNWEYVDAEHALYEPIGDEKHPHAFKGFIDGIIKSKGKRGEDIYWLLDFKTTSWGWSVDKKTDPKTTGQLVLYKNYWAKKTNTPIKNIRCGFILLKRSAKPGKHCELVTVSVGDVTLKRHLKVVNNMLASVKRGVAFKNKESCMFCDYKNTEHCT